MIKFLQNELLRIRNKVQRQLVERVTIGQHLDFKNPWILIATWFGSGVFLPGSGTWGTIATLPFVIPIWMFSGKIGLIAFLIIVFIVGMKASDVFEKETDSHDSGLIVVDEVIGYTIALLFIPLSAIWIAAAFLIFRAFDTIKPWPISWIDVNTKGAWGVIADDIGAGVATAITLLVLQYVGLFS